VDYKSQTLCEEEHLGKVKVNSGDKSRTEGFEASGTITTTNIE
jgi:hypothetical protein